MQGTVPHPHITEVIVELVDKLAPYCDDTETLFRLKELVANRGEMRKAHGIFSHQIRPKTIKAMKRGDRRAECQYLFEEVCAKTIYNLSRAPAPFDPDSPFWILPNAVAFCRILGFEDAGEVSPLLRMTE